MNTRQRPTLAAIVSQFAPNEGVNGTQIPGVECLRFSRAGRRLPTVYNPCVCFIVQGKKRVLLRDQVFEYKPGEFLAVSVDVPVIGEVVEGSSARPYLGLKISLDQAQLAELVATGERCLSNTQLPSRAVFVGQSDDKLSDCIARIADLLFAPKEISVLAPLLQRELYFRLLTSPHAQSITKLAQRGSHLQRIAQAIRILRHQFDKPVRVEYLANQVGMSVSSFHAHFKRVTAMSPLQFQKQLRLTEARQMMLSTQCDVVSAAYRVGYESPSQFNREYVRAFGVTPGRDADQHRVEQLGKRT
ncbi:transcriptional regulator [Arenicella chitinivorans]|uniref:Transcriptional regulator n=1 Tax=Arenicella chitinivorans TaxID=1329800 RepID=A0A918RKU7_9GAMM|nr:AraC family transcriptional regulator [Arenicella chitinivorans]GHA00387.1 transcriptional regulator [Arenicella chitinivorans]